MAEPVEHALEENCWCQICNKVLSGQQQLKIHNETVHGLQEEEEEEEEVVDEKDLIPCKICGRTFFPATLKKHVPICQKTAVKRRKTFDSSRQRAEGTDIPTVKPLKPKPEPPKKPSNWRRKHEDFIATIRAAKGVDKILKVGGELPPPPPPSYDPDYVQCPYCQRRFSENAADRHITFCKEQAARISNKGKLATESKTKPPPRTQYKPPALKKTNSPASVQAVSSRLPQPSSLGKTLGAPTIKVSSGNSPAGNKLQTMSPARRNSAGGTTPQSGSKKEKLGPPLRTGRDIHALQDSETRTDSGVKRPNELLPINKGSMKSRTPPSMVRNPAFVAAANKRKNYNAENYGRLDGNTGFEFGDHSPSQNGGIRKNGNGSGQFSKFCHECGTKYPVESAKFCCECGIRRMAV